MSTIYTALSDARDRGIQFPKLRLEEFIFSLSRHPFTIYVKHTSTREYLGKCTHLTFFSASPWMVTNEQRARIEKLLFTSIADSLKIYGQQTGRCGICGRLLTATDSIAASIGPICAEKFGIPLMRTHTTDSASDASDASDNLGF